MSNDRSETPAGGNAFPQRSRPRQPRKTGRSRTQPSVPADKPSPTEEKKRPAETGRLARTRRLLLAALRVWELKNDFRR